MICGRSGRIGYRASRRGTAKVAPAVCRRSKPTDVQKQGVPRETTLQTADGFTNYMPLSAVLTDIEVAQTSSGVRRYRPSVNRGRYKTECFTWNTVSTKQQMTLNVDENPKCGIFYVFYREIE